MALSKIESARNLSDEELIEAIVEVKQELFQLRFKQATRQLSKEVHQFKHARHRLAQLMTVQRERELAAVALSEVEAEVGTPSESTSVQ
ncbi:MAG: 50S ribosomal protein L29 [Cyanobacteria bacterium REEB459]|nr:50S ribosomal protein L29 [Cyanobacteria bacterium REEB459]